VRTDFRGLFLGFAGSLFVAYVTTLPTASAQSYTFGQGILATGTQPLSIATGDFNADGALDLVVVNRSDNTVSVYLSGQDGTFRSPVNYSTGPQPSSVAVGDFNGDANLDLIVTNENCTSIGHLSEISCESGSISVLLGNGDGTFEPQEQFATASRPLSVKAADLNGDGKLDLVVACLGSGSSISPLSTLLGNGDGTFQAHVDYPSPTGAGASWVVIADFNGDHKPDVATDDRSGVDIYLGNGDGTLKNPITFQLRDTPGSNSGAAAGDFNGDGKLDLAVPTVSGVDVFLGNGDGTFAFKAVFPGPQGPLVAVDLNQDGKLDLAGLGPDLHGIGFFVSALFGNGDGTFQTPLSQATGKYPSALTTGDWNGDGVLDVAVSVVNDVIFEPAQGAPVPAAGPSGSIFLFFGVGNGAFGFPPLQPAVNVASSTNFSFASMKAADLNGDAKLDLVFLTSDANIVSDLLSNGDGTFHAQRDFTTGTLPVFVQVADLNGDGKPDLVVVNQVCLFNATSCTPGSVSVLLGNGDGTFQPHVDYAVGVTPVSVAIADFNGDGKPDLAVTNSNLGLGNTISILTGKGDGTFNPHVVVTVVPEPGPIVAADFNHDGKIDLAVGCSDVANTNPCPAAISVSILLGNGDATFQRRDLLSNSFPSNPIAFPHDAWSFAVGDFNADSIPDLAIGGFSGNFGVFLGKGDGTFQAGGSGQGDENIGNETLAVGDFDADGKLDLALPQLTPRVLLFHGNGDGTFQLSQQLLLPEGLTFNAPIPASGDFDRDGSLDLAVLEPGTSTLSIILNKSFKSVFPGSLAFGSQGVGTSSATRTVTIGNPSVTPFHISSIAATGPYSQNNNCGAAVLPKETCAINITFMPVGAGAGNGAITLTDSTQASPQLIPLGGTGVNGPFLHASPSRLSFASPAVGTASSPQTVALSNTGNAALALSGISITGAAAADFQQTNTCGSSIAAGATCNVSVTFKPSAAGTRLALLSVADNAPGSPQTIPVGGNSPGPQVVLSTSSLTFGAQLGGTNSAAQVVTLTNTGNAALGVTSVVASGDFTQTNTCGTSVPANGSCQITVIFTPTAGGNRTGAVTITDSAPGSPRTIALTGTGEDFSIAPATTTASVSPGQTATYTLSFTAGGGLSGDVSLSCAGAPGAATCTISPASVSLNGSTPVTATVSVSTTAKSVLFGPLSNGRPSPIQNWPALWLIVTCMLAAIARIFSSLITDRSADGNQTRNPLGWISALAVLVIATATTLSSCGGGSSSGTTGGATGTQAGTYTITVMAKANTGSETITHTTQLTLVVQ
jgi:hypothetical protein